MTKREYDAVYYQANKEQIDKQHKKYNQTHKEQTRKREHQYYLDNKERLNKQHREWCQKNRDKILANRTSNSASVRISKEKRRQVARAWVWAYKSEHPCEKCGESDPICLLFHHPKYKKISVSRMVYQGYTISAIEKEISKCQLLCANCHIKVHRKPCASTGA